MATLSIDEAMVGWQDRQAAPVRRRDGFVERIRSGEPLPPLIALGASRHLADGYARLRALRLLGIVSGSVRVQSMSRRRR